MRIWHNAGNIAVTFCDCACCVRAYDLAEEGAHTDAACQCKGWPPSPHQDPECLCWFCVEAHA